MTPRVPNSVLRAMNAASGVGSFRDLKGFTPKEVKEIQEYLIAQGYNDIVADGKLGPKTFGALTGMSIRDAELQSANNPTDFTDLAMQADNSKQFLLDPARKELLRMGGYGAAGLTGLVGGAVGFNDIVRANSALRNLNQPQAAPLIQRNVQNDALRQRLSAMFNQGGDPSLVSGLNDANTRAYNTQINNAMAAGQAGAGMANAQAAFLNRLRANQNIMAERRKAQADYGSMLQSNISQQMAQDAANAQMGQSDVFNRQLPIFNQLRREALSRRATGMMGVNNALNTLASTAPSFASDMLGRNLPGQNKIGKFRKATN